MSLVKRVDSCAGTLYCFSDSEMSVERAETDAGNVKEAEAFQLSEEMKRGLYN